MPMNAPAPAPPLATPAPAYHRWLQALAWLLVAATFALVAIGGTVTSLEAGLAVPDGWMTFDDFTPLAPLETWWHDLHTRWEHSHRLKGYIVGMLTLGVAAGLWFTGGHKGRRALAGALVVMVIAQGVMGALRVDLAQIESRGPGIAATGIDNPLSTAFRIFHGITGQVFLCLTVVAAVVVGRPWLNHVAASKPIDKSTRRMVRLAFWLWVVFLIQLTLGAAVRHTHSALAIPDFPLHFGGLIPPTSQAALDSALTRAGITADIELWQVYLHLAHRLFAGVVCVAAVWGIARIFKATDWADAVLGPSITIIALLVVQVVLGITVVLSGEAAMVATTHQVVGAVLFASAAWLVLRTRIAAGQISVEAQAKPSPEPASGGRMLRTRPTMGQMTGETPVKPSPELASGGRRAGSKAQASEAIPPLVASSSGAGVGVEGVKGGAA